MNYIGIFNEILLSKLINKIASRVISLLKSKYKIDNLGFYTISNLYEGDRIQILFNKDESLENMELQQEFDKIFEEEYEYEVQNIVNKLIGE